MNGDKMHLLLKQYVQYTQNWISVRKTTVCGTEGITESSCKIIQLENDSCVLKNTGSTCGCLMLLSYYISLEELQGEQRWSDENKNYRDHSYVGVKAIFYTLPLWIDRVPFCNLLFIKFC